MAPTEELDWKAAQFLIDIRETCKTSHATLEKISDGVINLVDVYSSHILVSKIKILTVVKKSSQIFNFSNIPFFKSSIR